MVTPGNPNNCGRISGTHFPNRHRTKKETRSVRGLSGDEIRTYALLFRAFKLKKLLPHKDAENFEVLNDICVRADGTLVGDGMVVGSRPISDSIAILLLIAGGEVWGPSKKAPEELREKCIAAVESEDEVRATLRCARYPGSGRIVSEAVRDAARLQLTGPLTDDALRRRLNVARSRGKSQRAAALEFRLEDRRILAEVAKGENERRPKDETDPTSADSEEEEEEERTRTLPERVEKFNDFIASLDLPVNKIEARILEGRGGDRFGDISMLGAFATEDIGQEEVYISLSPGSVIDATTAISEAEQSSPGLADLLKKLAFGDYYTIVLYLLHERFVVGERSKWWPYLDIMPTVGEMRRYHPIFIPEEDLNTKLVGTDVRNFLIGYLTQASKRHEFLGQFIEAHEILGWDVLLDKSKVYWAFAIVDSRSIIYEGRRHLVPLLDLVNAGTEGRKRKTVVEDDSVVTRASGAVTAGSEVLENYALPNYELFVFRGFILKNNPDDCALVDGMRINRDDPGAETAAEHLTSRKPLFCIKDADSLNKIAHFLRVKHGLPLSDEDEFMDKDVKSMITQVLQKRALRMMDFAQFEMASALEMASTDGGLDSLNGHPAEMLLLMILNDDLRHYTGALSLL